jgi:hypothetical protein
MKEKFRHCFLLLGIFLTLSSSSAQAQMIPGGSMGFSVPGTKKVQIHFRLVNNLIIIPLIINGSDTLQFILDTGIENTIISEMSLGDTLALKYTRVTPITGLGIGKPLDGVVSSGNTFTLPGIIGTGQTVFVLLQDIFDLSNELGTRVHGLIGYRIFRHFIVHIDYERRVITLYDPKTYHHKKKRRATVFPLTFHGSKPYLSAVVVNPRGEEVPVNLLLDTGLSFGLWLLPGTTKGLYIPSPSVPAFLGTGLNGRINGRMARIPAFRLGPFSFKDPVVGFPDTLSFTSANILDNRNGTLGSGILHRFSVTIDYFNQRIILEPNQHFKDPFPVNNAGIHVSAPIPGFRYYIISDIRRNSPAARAGLKKGDMLEKINGKSASHMSMDEIYRIFQNKPGRLIRITVLRHGLKFETMFYLERFL